MIPVNSFPPHLTIPGIFATVIFPCILLRILSAFYVRYPFLSHPWQPNLCNAFTQSISFLLSACPNYLNFQCITTSHTDSIRKLFLSSSYCYWIHAFAKCACLSQWFLRLRILHFSDNCCRQFVNILDTLATVENQGRRHALPLFQMLVFLLYPPHFPMHWPLQLQIRGAALVENHCWYLISFIT